MRSFITELRRAEVFIPDHREAHFVHTGFICLVSSTVSSELSMRNMAPVPAFA